MEVESSEVDGDKRCRPEELRLAKERLKDAMHSSGQTLLRHSVCGVQSANKICEGSSCRHRLV